MVPPDRVKMPHADTFCLVRVFWTAETNVPAPPVIMVALIDWPMASFGWYTASDEAMMGSSKRSLGGYTAHVWALIQAGAEWGRGERGEQAAGGSVVKVR